MDLNFDLVNFLKLAKPGRVIPLYTRLFGNSESPLALYEKLVKGRTNTFLLESAEQGIWSRFSFIGLASQATITQRQDELGLRIVGEVTLPDIADSLEALKSLISMWQVEQDESLPPLTSGLVGFFSWDLIRQIEALPQAKPRSYQHPILQLQLVRDLVVIDHLENSIWLISNVYCLDEETNQKQYEMATAAIEELSKEIEATANALQRGLGKWKHQHYYKQNNLIVSNLSRNELLRLHTTCHCFVSASFGEGWGIPAFDAYAMGNRVIHNMTD
ncbi:MAG: hypothetical protein RIQ88_1107, partial [Actinomycetota bacterium]